MKPEITPDEYSLLPPRRKRFYEFDEERNLWVLKQADFTLAGLLFLTFSLSRGGYVNERGQRVSDRNIRNRFKLASNDLGMRLMNEARGFMAGDPSIDEQVEYLRRRRTQLEAYYRAAARIGLGNPNEVGPILDAAAGQQLIFFDNLIDEVAAGRKLAPGRLGMYGRALYPAYENSRRLLMSARGFTFERRILGKADHCDKPVTLRKVSVEAAQKAFQKMTGAPLNSEARTILGATPELFQVGAILVDCPTLDASDWQPIGTLPPIGFSPCLTNCRCHFEFR